MMIELRHISRLYKTNDIVQRALDNISVGFRSSEFVAILGSSGSGKTTLLNIIGGLDRATSGDLLIDGVSTARYKSADWDTYRNHHVGFIFQSYNLIPHQNVISNVEIALTLSGIKADERRARARAALERVGLGDHLYKKPNQLSGGQAQRVAIARALVNDPDIVLADEPTGALDSSTGVAVMDILKDIAQERLVIMVTHNPELAEAYATRIVTIKDGSITSDTNPVDLGEEEVVYIEAPSTAAPPSPGGVVRKATTTYRRKENAPAVLPEKRKHSKRTSMSFLTALSLSLSNLMTKKGRTFLTAFAGSIGIIGIAAILALSNGVNSYIQDVERNSMSQFPLMIERESIDTSGMFGVHTGGSDALPLEDETQTNEGDIPQNQRIKEMYNPEIGKIKKNNLQPFMAYIKSGGSNIQKLASNIEYNYNVTPLFLKQSNTSYELVGKELSGSGGIQGGFNPFDAQINSQNGFSQMLENLDTAKENYELVKGSWPTKSSDALLVLDDDGRIDDYVLYGLGILDNKKVDEYVKKVTNKKKNQKDPEVPTAALTLDDALDLTYTAIPSAYTYHKVKGDIWEQDTSEKRLKDAVTKGIKISVVGVIKPLKETNFKPFKPGIVYTHALSMDIIDLAKDSPAVKAQIAHPKRDIFSGRTFKDIEEGKFDDKDTQNIIGVDTAALEDALSGVDFDNIGGGSFALDPDAFGSFNAEALQIKPEDLHIDPDKLIKSINTKKILDIIGNAPTPSFNSIEEVTIDKTVETELKTNVIELGQAFMPWYLAHKQDLPEDATPQQIYDAYIADPQVAERLQKIQLLLGDSEVTKVKTWLESYLQKDLIPYSTKAFEELFKELSAALAAQLSEAFALKFGGMMADFAEVLSEQLSMAFANFAFAGMNLAAMPGGMENIASMNMQGGELAKALMNFYNPQSVSYEDNLHRLGYANVDNPSSIYIYPSSFQNKEEIDAAIKEYNEKVTADGHPEDVIEYNDVVKQLLTSVTSIVDMISLVLIAFVSISLVVSSIMIGIITYISVLERRKEIGILRAMGASKGNIANVFNAETTIEGAIAGIFAVVVVLLISIPVNSAYEAINGYPTIMSLPPAYALALVGISILLTLLAGLIPSAKAARKDPVEALRSE